MQKVIHRHVIRKHGKVRIEQDALAEFFGDLHKQKAGMLPVENKRDAPDLGIAVKHARVGQAEIKPIVIVFVWNVKAIEFIHIGSKTANRLSLRNRMQTSLIIGDAVFVEVDGQFKHADITAQRTRLHNNAVAFDDGLFEGMVR